MSDTTLVTQSSQASPAGFFTSPGSRHTARQAGWLCTLSTDNNGDGGLGQASPQTSEDSVSPAFIPAGTAMCRPV
jgi:hypothetical protein